MLLDCTICTETSGNGVLTIGMITIWVRQQMAVLGLTIIMIFLKKKEEPCCGAVPGTGIRTAVLHLVTSICATTITTILVFVLSAELGVFFTAKVGKWESALECNRRIQPAPVILVTIFKNQTQLDSLVGVIAEQLLNSTNKILCLTIFENLGQMQNPYSCIGNRRIISSTVIASPSGVYTTSPISK